MRIITCARILLIVSLMAAPASAQKKANGEWRFYGGDNGSTKYSPLDQINKDNVAGLKSRLGVGLARSAALQKANRQFGSFALRGDAADGRRHALHQHLAQPGRGDQPADGRNHLGLQPRSYKAGRPTNLGFVHRGVAYWTDGKQERIFIATADAYLWAIDAKTGKAVAEFGEAGKVNLAKAIPLAVNARNYAVTSPPVICRDVVMLGSSISDGPANKETPRGDIQAFDVRTGKPLWIFHSVPQAGEFGKRDLGERFVEIHRQHERLDADERGRRVSAMSICRSARRQTIGTAAIGLATTSSPNRWSAWTQRRASASGIFKPCITVCGIMICLGLPCSAK